MLHYARQIVRFTSHLTLDGLLSNDVSLSATLYSVMILGEASRRVSPEFRARHPQIPWREMIGMRNRLIHGYDGVDYEIVWDVLANHAPMLVRELPAIRAAETPPAV